MMVDGSGTRFHNKPIQAGVALYNEGVWDGGFKLGIMPFPNAQCKSTYDSQGSFGTIPGDPAE
jgi:hypothetical protein